MKQINDGESKPMRQIMSDLDRIEKRLEHTYRPELTEDQYLVLYALVLRDYEHAEWDPLQVISSFFLQDDDEKTGEKRPSADYFKRGYTSLNKKGILKVLRKYMLFENKRLERGSI